MSARTAVLAAVLFALAPAGSARGAAEAAATLDAATKTRAIEALEERLVGCGTAEACMARAARLALVEEKQGTPLQQVAAERVIQNAQLAKEELLRLYRGGAPDLQLRVIRLMDAAWESFHRSTDFVLVNLVLDALEHPSPEIRGAAADLVVQRPFRGVGNRLVDAAEADPALTVRMLQAIRLAADPLVARWVLGRFNDKDPAVRAEAQRAFASFRRSGLYAVQDWLGSEDPARRRAAVEALLLIATPEDVPTLTFWLQTHGAAEPALAERVTKAIAALEAGEYRPQYPTLRG